MDIEIGVEKYYTSQLLEDNPTSLFIDGDNVYRRGKGGQDSIRDGPNSIGLVTKNDITSYFTDLDLSENKISINLDIDLIKEKDVKERFMKIITSQGYKDITFTNDRGTVTKFLNSNQIELIHGKLSEN